MPKDTAYRRLISSARWRRLRRAALSRRPLCQDCLEQGIVEPATEVHHVRPVEEALGAAERERRAYDPSNLRPLCHACHLRAHQEMGRTGRAAARRIRREHARQAARRLFGEEEGGEEGGRFF